MQEQGRYKKIGKPYNAADVWLGVVSPEFGEEVVVDRPLNSPVVTSYRLPGNRRPISHRFRSAPTCHRQTDRRNWSSKRRHYPLKCIGRQNWH